MWLEASLHVAGSFAACGWITTIDSFEICIILLVSMEEEK
jgi:hypothetical protein